MPDEDVPVEGTTTVEPGAIRPVDHLSEDFQGRDTIARFENLPALAKAYMEVRSKVGGMSSLPSEHTSDVDRTSFYRKLGAPETEDGYDLPEANEEMGDLLKSIRQTALGVGITKKQWSALSRQAVDNSSARDAEIAKLLDGHGTKWREEAKELYGDKYDETVGMAQRMLDHLKGGPEVKQVLELTRLGDHPALLGLFAKVGEVLGNDRIPAGLGGSPLEGDQQVKTAEQLSKRFKEIHASEGFKKSHHPDHDDLSEELLDIGYKLTEMGYEGVFDPRLNKKGEKRSRGLLYDAEEKRNV